MTSSSWSAGSQYRLSVTAEQIVAIKARRSSALEAVEAVEAALAAVRA
ncbi:MAG TPA: hypothetical protein VNT55_22750 [Baekduia sp.]|nr:hypothetical protein [Baekduia sp.]